MTFKPQQPLASEKLHRKTIERAGIMVGIESPARPLPNLILTVDSFPHYRLGPSSGLQTAVPCRPLSSNQPRSRNYTLTSCLVATAQELTVDSFLHYSLGPSPSLQAAVQFHRLSSISPKACFSKFHRVSSQPPKS